MSKLTKDNIAFGLLVMFLVLCALMIIVGVPYALYLDAFHPYQCTKEVKVVAITEMRHRSTTFVDEHGDTHSVNQGVYKVGDILCVESERKP